MDNLNKQINEYKEQPTTSLKWKLMMEIAKQPNRNELYEKAMGPTRYGQQIRKQRIAKRIKQHLSNPIMNSCALSKKTSVEKGSLPDIINQVINLDSEVKLFMKRNKDKMRKARQLQQLTRTEIQVDRPSELDDQLHVYDIPVNQDIEKEDLESTESASEENNEFKWQNFSQFGKTMDYSWCPKE